MSIPKVKLGSQGLNVSSQGLGCAGMSGSYGPPKPEEDMISLIRFAISNGITFLDTSDKYGHNHSNEILVGKAIKGIREQVQLATKFGVKIVEGKAIVRGDPEYVRECCEASLKRLGVDYIDLYYQHSVDTSVPIELTVGEMKKLVEEGKVKYIGLSEASPDTIRRAHAIHPITAVQIEWSLWTRDVEEDLIPTCRELGIGIVAFSPLGRGFLSSGPQLAETLADGDFRKNIPRFQAEHMEKNRIAYDHICRMAVEKGCSPSQLALAWLHHQKHAHGHGVVPIPGTTKVKNVEENMGALSLELTVQDMKKIADAVSAVTSGDRFPTEMASTFKTWNIANTPPLL